MICPRCMGNGYVKIPNKEVGVPMPNDLLNAANSEKFKDKKFYKGKKHE
jgi:hypothetical protein